MGRVITPLTLPLTIDGGALSVAIRVGASHAHTVHDAVVQFVAAAIIGESIFLTYRYAQQVVERIGRTGMLVLHRLSAFIMPCFGVSILWNGVQSMLGTIGLPAPP